MERGRGGRGGGEGEEVGKRDEKERKEQRYEHASIRKFSSFLYRLSRTTQLNDDTLQ